MMKKSFSLMMALALVLLTMIPVLAEDDPEKDISGIWTDENFDRMELTIVPSEITWFDERMGEEDGVQKYVVFMNWPSSESEVSTYHIVGSLDETGKKLNYTGGMFADYVYDDDGNVDEEETVLLEDNGTGCFTVTENGTLLWEDSYLAEAAEMTLTRLIPSAPSSEEIKAGYYQQVIGLEEGTAGASLKLAQAVESVYWFCSICHFWCMDHDPFEKALVDAQNSLTAEEKAAFDRNRGALTLEITRLLDENEEMGSIYEDAGVEAHMIDLRNDPAVRLSVETFIFAVETLNEEP